MYPTLSLDLADEAATLRLGARLAAHARPGDVIALQGPLGAGKTLLARGFIQALLDEEEEVHSPTFTLVLTYDTPVATVWHFDLYRLNQPEEALELGLDDALAGGIVLIEWPERLGSLLPRRRLDVALDPAKAKSGHHITRRRILLTSRQQWDDRIGELA
jgi:tRNA threonylcarbamoyladenosine biosynthesis protein TsaE